jgi:hypothetical protein
MEAAMSELIDTLMNWAASDTGKTVGAAALTALAWAEASTVVGAAYMKRMIPLRITAMLGNVLGVTLGLIIASPPTIAKHAINLPLNFTRMREMQAHRQRARSQRQRPEHRMAEALSCIRARCGAAKRSSRRATADEPSSSEAQEIVERGAFSPGAIFRDGAIYDQRQTHRDGALHRRRQSDRHHL